MWLSEVPLCVGLSCPIGQYRIWAVFLCSGRCAAHHEMMLCPDVWVSNLYLVSSPCTLFFETAVNHAFLPYIRSWHKLCLDGLSIFIYIYIYIFLIFPVRSADKFSVDRLHVLSHLPLHNKMKFYKKHVFIGAICLTETLTQVLMELLQNQAQHGWTYTLVKLYG